MPTMMARDEQHTQQIVDHIQNHMTDPFSVDQHEKLLLNIGFGLLATPDISDNLSVVCNMPVLRHFALW